MIARLLLSFGIPFVLGFIVRGLFDRAMAKRDARIRLSVERDHRAPRLEAASDDELLSELAKRDLHSPKDS